jgi:hypothetical protein
MIPTSRTDPERNRAMRLPRFSILGHLPKIAALLVLGAAAGCNPPSIEDVCGELEDQSCSLWSGYYECVEDGKAVRARVEQAGGCDGALDDYLFCLGDLNDCGWSVCSDEREALERCIGPL